MRAEPGAVASLSFDAIGTAWQIDTPAPIPAATVSRMQALIEDFDRTWSRFRSDSLVAEVATTAGDWVFPAEAPALVGLYSALHTATQGAMSPLVGGSLTHLGYGAGYSLVPGSGSIASPDWQAMDWDGTRLRTEEPIELDVGAAGKGLLVDLVVELLEHDGIEQIVVDASGDLRHAGGDPVRVALEHPYDTTKAIGIATLADGALCASASNRRVWGSGLHHVLDARTGIPVDEVVATWVSADTAMLADAIATALFFSPAEDLAVVAEFEHVRMFTDGRAEMSAGFPGELFR
ncbi:MULTISPECIES: FAD:protein FMN transferase [unclassified Leifsonia]|uniref:FAD:protein FMN transferase n=1 Tax=unclassified Leifsonia TaxID=2663824 RepID=UPI0006F4F473|nr:MULTISPECIES: FAD:protein FMN transferase [unclassified Leifsonia]KQX06463.1 hypothetical protein ASC59_00885 [Leifsonia sp. Root1293]KRA10746.1 hypothetical protein ASD61_00885 [Leifsonia sp. Root60]